MSIDSDTRRSDAVGLDSGIEALQTSPQFSGPVETLDDHPCNDHLAHLYEDPVEQVATAVPFLAQGLERGERCMYVIDELSREDVVGAFRDAGVDVDDALETGQLSFHTVEETYLRDGSFDPDEMIQFYGAAIDEATREYEALRISAETTWLQHSSVQMKDFMEYEAKVNRLFHEQDVIAICHYDRTAFSPEDVRDVIETHPHLIYDGTVCHNFYYTGPEEYFEPDEAASEVDRMMGTLLERTQAKVALQTNVQFLQALYDVTSDTGLSFEAKVERLLELGCERLDLDVGYVATVDADADRFEVVEAVGSHRQIQQGASGTYTDSYCRKTLETSGPTSVVDAAGEGWEDDAAYDTYGLESYLGTPLLVDGERWGTLCFGSESPRERTFTDPERTFVDVINQWMRYELERQQRERYERELYEITADSDHAFEEKVERLLELGRERFGLEVGALAELPSRNGDFRIEVAVGPDELQQEGALPVQPGDECYCRHAIDATEPIAVSDVHSVGWQDDPIYEQYGLESYLGIEVAIDAEPYGTLWFGGTEPRSKPFSDAERTFLELVAQWMNSELERQERERRLQRCMEYTDDLLDAVDDQFYVLDRDGNLQRWNETATEVTGYTDDELGSKNAMEFFEGEDQAAIADGLADVFEEGGARVEAEFVTQDGATVPYEFVASGLEDPDGNPVLTGIGRDVSERVARERAQRELYEATASKDLTFGEKMQRLLELGCDRFGLDQGYVTRYHPDEGVVENEHVVGPADQELRTGIPEAQPEPGQFCRATVEAHEPICAPDVREVGWEDDPVYRESGLRSYVGVTVTDGIGTYGTLAFCDVESREEPFSDAERTFLELMGQWVSHELEQRRRQEQLAALNEMSRAVMGAESPEEIADVAVEYAADALDLPLTAIVTYDGATGELSPLALSPRAEDQLPAVGLCDRDGGRLWEAFVEGESSVFGGVSTLPGASDDITETLAVPLGQQGLFVTASVTPDGFPGPTREFVETTAATVEAGFTRADREQELQEREGMLEEQNVTLERLNRVNDIIRNIDQSLVQASTREEIAQVVCEQLADAGPYEMAWVGEHDPATEEVRPIEWAGNEKGYLDEITVTADDAPTGQGPLGRAIRNHESRAVNDILQDDRFRPWRQEALNRGYHGCISLPLVYGETLYGVVVIYAGQPGVFGGLERAVLDELSDTIAYAINAVESKKALVSDEVTMLEFEVEDDQLEVVELTRELDCTFAMESLVPREDGGVRGFYSTRGAPAADVIDHANRLPTLDVTLISEYEEDGEPVCLFESKLTEESLASTVLAHGGQPRSFAVSDGTANVTVEVAADAAVREFVRMFQSMYPDSELVAQRSRERSGRSPMEFRAALADQLTDRQFEALQTAYFSGYFEQPRVRKGTDVAETLGVAQPTFTSHLRCAQRKVCEQLFDESTLGD